MARSPKVQLVIDGKDNTKGAFGTVEKGLDGLQKRTASLSKSMAGAFVGVISLGTLKRIADVNMEFRKLDRVLKENTEGQEDFNYAQKETAEIADQLGVSLDGVVNNFGKLNGSMAALGYSSKESIRVTEILSKLMSLEGADPTPTIARFTRMLSKGELHQARFNLMLQDQPALLNLVSLATGKTIEQLRELSATGELTAEMMTDAVLQMGDSVDVRFGEMPQTIEQAMTRIRGNIAEAFRDEELMQPIVDSLNELADVLKDPAVREGLASLASALAKAAKGGATALSELGDGFGSLAHGAKQLDGTTSLLEDLEYQLKQVDRSLNNTGMSTTLGSLLPKDYLLQQKNQLEGWIELAKTGQDEAVLLDKEIEALRFQLSLPLAFRMPFTGTSENIRQQIAEKERERDILIERFNTAREAAEEQTAIEKEAQEKQQAALRKHVADMKTERDQLVAGVKNAAKDIETAEKDSLKKIEDLRKERLGIEERYRKAIAKLTGASGPVEATYGNAQLLKSKAREALSKGDLKEAQEYAASALEILEKIKEEGGNTYGFEGFAKELEGIELAAKDQEIKKEDEKRKKIIYDLTKLKELAEEVENIDIRVDLDEESLTNVRSKLDQLAKGVDITPSVVGAGAAGAAGGTVEVKVDADIEPLKKKIYQEGSNSWTDKPLYLEVEPKPVDQQAVEQALGDSEVSTSLELDQSSVAQVGSEISSAAEQLAAAAVVPVTLQMQGGGTDQLPGYATGGHIRGPGTGTSDSILARLSNGEFVMRSAAVRKYGLDMLHRMNNMQIPQFATGGLVEQAASIEPKQPAALGTLNFNLPGGESFSVNTPDAFSDELRRAAIKYGKPRR